MSKLFTDQQGQQQSPAEAADPVIRLQKLKHLLDDGIITQDEFNAKKKEWLDKL
jgi:membrane protease subunit (stomatin/prohibitin family)